MIDDIGTVMHYDLEIVPPWDMKEQFDRVKQ